MVDMISMMIGFGLVFVLSLVFMFFLKGGFKELICLMGVFNLFAFIGGLVDLWTVILLLVIVLVVVMGNVKKTVGDNRE